VEIGTLGLELRGELFGFGHGFSLAYSGVTTRTHRAPVR